MSRSVPWAAGNYNMRGKKTLPIRAGKYVEADVRNYKGKITEEDDLKRAAIDVLEWRGR